MATLLSTIQQVCERLAQPKPTTVMGSADKSVVQFRALLEEGLEQLVARGAWPRLVQEYTWTTLAAESQGNFTDGLGSAPVAFTGFGYLLPHTLWDRTNKLPLIGPLDAQDWQELKSWVLQGPQYQFRLRGNEFLVNPEPTAGLTWAFEYVMDCPIQATGAGAFKKLFTADTDDILIPDPIVKLDLRWRWKATKGLAYAQEFDDCERLIADALSRKRAGRVLHLDDGRREVGPKVVIPSGSWNL